MSVITGQECVKKLDIDRNVCEMEQEVYKRANVMDGVKSVENFVKQS